MRLGLIGTGKQGQRYLMEKNGGRHIVRSGSREIDYEGLDGVIIATHPAGHKKLAMECIERGLPVLVEKPLALNLADCEEILDAAKAHSVRLDVAHTHLWAHNWSPTSLDTRTLCHIAYTEHWRDYSPWLDWGPHGVALVAAANRNAPSQELRESVCLHQADEPDFTVAGCGWSYSPERHRFTPMWLMMRAFVLHLRPAWGGNGGYWQTRNDFNRRVYRALFTEEP